MSISTPTSQQGHTSATQNSYATGSITPTSGRAYVLFMTWSKGSAPNSIFTLTGSGGFGGTWHGTVARNYNTTTVPLKRMEVWWTYATSSSPGSITADFNGVNQTGFAWVLVEMASGFDPTTLEVGAGHRSTPADNGSALSLPSSYGGAFATSDNIGLHGFGTAGPSNTTPTASNSWTVLGTIENYNNGSLFVAYGPANNNSVTGGWSGTAVNAGGVGIEISAVVSAVTVTDTETLTLTDGLGALSVSVGDTEAMVGSEGVNVANPAGTENATFADDRSTIQADETTNDLTFSESVAIGVATGESFTLAEFSSVIVTQLALTDSEAFTVAEKTLIVPSVVVIVVDVADRDVFTLADNGAPNIPLTASDACTVQETSQLIAVGTSVIDMQFMTLVDSSSTTATVATSDSFTMAESAHIDVTIVDSDPLTVADHEAIAALIAESEGYAFADAGIADTGSFTGSLDADAGFLPRLSSTPSFVSEWSGTASLTE